MANLQNKSITQLRGIAQSFGIENIFQMDRVKLTQTIEMKQAALQPIPEVVIPKPDYDARLMSKPPAKQVDGKWAKELLREYISRGLNFRVDEHGERWYMVSGKKNDEGTMRMRPDTLLSCAKRVMA